MSDRQRTSLIVLVFGLVTLVLCHPVLSGNWIFGFRDASLFYYPLFSLVRSEWLSGQIPLWNPWLNGGQPLAAAATASVFYPGQLVLLLPLPLTWLFNAYLLVHLSLAGWGAFRLARAQQATVYAAGLAALTYAFGGSVLFQTCNVVFLCGAAWLPWGVLIGQRLLPHAASGATTVDAIGSRIAVCGNILKLAGVLTMMVLAGDPQAAYHTGLILGVMALLKLFSRGGDAARTIRQRLTATLISSAWLLGAAVLAIGLAFTQIALTSEFSQFSERLGDTTPLSLWEVRSFLSRQSELEPRADTGRLPRWYDSIVGDPAAPAKQYAQVYGFSLEPYRVLEFVWPQICGTAFPAPNRWTVNFEIERPQYWTLSIYSGLWPFFLALGAFGLRSDPVRRRWSWLMVLTLLACFGEYGIVWATRVVRDVIWFGEVHWERQSGGEVGGLYWLMVTLLPGYSNFRFPAKWTVPLALSVAQLAAMGLDQMMSCPAARRRVRRWTLVSVMVLTVGMLIAGVIRGTSASFAPSSDQFKQHLVVWWAVVSSCGLGLILSCIAYWGLNSSHWSMSTAVGGSEPPSHMSHATLIVLLVTAADLAWSNANLVLFVPLDSLTGADRLVAALREDRESTLAGQVSPQLRYFRTMMWTGVVRDFRQETRFQGETLGQNVAWLHPVSSMNKRDTMELNEFTVFFDVLPSPDGERFVQPRRSYDLWSVEYFLLPSESNSSDSEMTTEGLERDWSEAQLEGQPLGPVPLGKPASGIVLKALAGQPGENVFRVLRNPSALPRVRIVHRATVIEPVSPANRNRWIATMLPLAFGGEQGGNPAREALIEDDLLARQSPRLEESVTDEERSRESCRILRDDSQRVEIVAELARPGLVILSDTFYPGWSLQVHDASGAEENVRQLRVNRLQRGCWLPAGRHHLVFSYHPPGLTGMLALNAFAVLAWLAGMMACGWVSRGTVVAASGPPAGVGKPA